MSKKKEQLQKVMSSLKSLREYGMPSYIQKVELYKSMMNGSDGGEFRKSGSSLRELHFSKWTNFDFYLLLVGLGETEELTEEQINEKFPVADKSIFNKIAGWFS